MPVWKELSCVDDGIMVASFPGYPLVCVHRKGRATKMGKAYEHSFVNEWYWVDVRWKKCEYRAHSWFSRSWNSSSSRFEHSTNSPDPRSSTQTLPSQCFNQFVVGPHPSPRDAKCDVQLLRWVATLWQRSNNWPLMPTIAMTYWCTYQVWLGSDKPGFFHFVLINAHQ